MLIKKIIFIIIFHNKINRKLMMFKRQKWKKMMKVPFGIY